MTLAFSLVIAQVSCAEEPLPEPQISRDDCLNQVVLKRLDEAIRRCDRVVKKFPEDPLPLNDRFLLHILAGDEVAACLDVTQAVRLTKRISPSKLDPLLRNDLRLRQASCLQKPSQGIAASSPHQPSSR